MLDWPPYIVVLNGVLFALLLGIALVVTRHRGLYADAMLMGLFSLVSASLFAQLDALDVSLTEAAVGAGVSTVLFVTALGLTRSSEAVTPKRRVVPGLLVAFLAGGGLIYASTDLPPIGEPNNPVHQHPLTEAYLVGSQEEIGIPNVVTSVLASYRGYDTLGEVVVVFTAGIGVLMLMLGSRNASETGPEGVAPGVDVTRTEKPRARRTGKRGKR